MQQKIRLIEKLRLDALTDGVFAVAMTLLVIDLKLPESFHPTNAEEFLHGLFELKTQFLVYVISFIVLGLRWMSLAKLSRLHETVEDRYVQWSLAHLMLITCVPFSTMMVGRYGAFTPAIWLYCANTIEPDRRGESAVAADHHGGEWNTGDEHQVRERPLDIAVLDRFVQPGELGE